MKKVLFAIALLAGFASTSAFAFTIHIIGKAQTYTYNTILKKNLPNTMVVFAGIDEYGTQTIVLRVEDSLKNHDIHLYPKGADYVGNYGIRFTEDNSAYKRWAMLIEKSVEWAGVAKYNKVDHQHEFECHIRGYYSCSATFSAWGDGQNASITFQASNGDFFDWNGQMPISEVKELQRLIKLANIKLLELEKKPKVNKKDLFK